MTADRTFLFSDIEGSTRGWEEHPSLMRHALARHDELMAQLISRHGGALVKHTGEGVLAVFGNPVNGLLVAAEAQRALAGGPSTAVEPLRVRMGIHRGAALEVRSDFFGPTVNRCSRLMAVAHGGQVVLE